MEEKKKKPAQTLREYLKGLKDSAGQVVWVFTEFTNRRLNKMAAFLLTLTFLSTSISYVVPWYTGTMMDGAVKKDVHAVVLGMVYALAVTVISLVIDIVAIRGRIGYDAAMSEQINAKISGLFFRMSVGQHRREGSELNPGNVQKGSGQVDSVVSDVAFNGLPTIVQIMATYVLLWWLSGTVALFMTGIAVLFFFSSLVLNHLSIKRSDVVSEKERLANRTRNDLWNGVERVKNNGMEETVLAQIIKLRQEALKAYTDLWLRLDPLFQVRGFLMDLVGLAVTAYGFYLVLYKGSTIGMIMPLTAWSRSFVSGLRQLSWMERRLQNALPHITSLREAVFVPPDITDKADAVDLPAGVVPRIRFRNVGYTYPDSSDEKKDKVKPAVLRDINFEIAPHSKVAIVGASGAGKTTLSGLLMRYDDPTGGGIEIDGIDLRDMRRASWIAAIGHIAQQPQVFDGTIRDNLLFGLSDEAKAQITDERLMEVMRSLKIDFGNRLTDGLDTQVGLKGLKLSGGEAQRLLIGAAVIRQPRFMIIDEATSSLDSTTEKEVQAGLEMVLSGNMSAIVIAHRLSTIRNCDQIIVLRDADKLQSGESQIEAIGSSLEELYDVSPTLRRMVDDQEMVMRHQSTRAAAAE